MLVILTSSLEPLCPSTHSICCRDLAFTQTPHELWSASHLNEPWQVGGKTVGWLSRVLEGWMRMQMLEDWSVGKRSDTKIHDSALFPSLQAMGVSQEVNNQIKVKYSLGNRLERKSKSSEMCLCIFFFFFRVPNLCFFWIQQHYRYLWEVPCKEIMVHRKPDYWTHITVHRQPRRFMVEDKCPRVYRGL